MDTSFQVYLRRLDFIIAAEKSLKQRATWLVLLERWVGNLLVRRLWK